MKVSLFMLLFGVCLASANNAFSQESRLSFRFSDISIKQAINEIEKNSDYIFVWTDNIDNEANTKVNVNVNDAALGQILDHMFERTRLAYRILDKQVVIYVADYTRKPPAKEDAKVTQIQQQTKFTINGKVTTTTGEELIGVNIQVKGTTTGTITDVNGNYSIEVEPGNTLIYSYVSYLTQEIPVGNRRTINVQLIDNSEVIEEVVVVGYGTQKKADLTSAISTLDPSEVLKTPGGITDALQGNVAGVNVSGGKIRIRGTSSITGNTDPLWVVDGVIDGSVPNDDEIESIQILKDAASAAIYGVRGANGVIVVTTKQGKLGQPRISFNSYVGTGSPARKVEMLKARDYAVYVNELFYNAATPSAIADGSWNNVVPSINAKPSAPMAQTDWWNEYFHPNVYQKYDLAVSGANESADYRLGATYTGDDNHLNRNNKTQNIYANIRGTRGRFSFGGRAQLSYSYNQTTSGASLGRMLYLPPSEPVYDDNNKDINGGFFITGTSADGLDVPNQAWYVHNERNRAKAINALGNVFGELRLFDWLRYKVTYTYAFTNSNATLFRPAYYLGNDAVQDYNYQSTSINGMNRNMVENLLSFDKTFGAQHVLSGVAGITSETFHMNSRSLGGRSREKKDFGVEDVFQEEATNAGSASDNSYFSYLARLMYSYAGKYMFTGNFRADESSKFARGKRWGYFPSFSVGWRISEEPWMKEATSAWLSNLKLRATLGWIGSAGAVGNYDYQAAVNTVNRMYTFGPNQASYMAADSNVPAPLPEAISNKDLSWETTRDAGFGFDMTMLDNKLSLTFDYYNRKVYDMLLNVQLPSSVGAHPGFGTASVYMNVGEMTNWGLELSAVYRDRIAGKLSYVIAPNFSFYRNKVTDLGNIEYLAGGYVLSGAYVTHTTVGSPVAQYWGLKTDGLFKTDQEAAAYVNANGQRLQPAAKAGDIKYLDSDGSGSIGEEDKTFIGSSIPTASLGLNLSLAYAGFDLSMLWQGDLGISVFNNWKSTLLAGKVPQNQLARMKDRFRATDLSFTTAGGETISLPANTGSTIPRAVLSDPNDNSGRASDFFVEDASYLRCNNLTLGYALPPALLKSLRIEQLRLYAGVKNPFTITNYAMFDPQVPHTGSTLDRGVDGAVYYSTTAFLSQREYFAGIQLTF